MSQASRQPRWPWDLYRNLHTATWSLLARKPGKVVAHPQEVLVEVVRFVVQPGGTKRVRKTKKKHVHAFVRGSVIDVNVDGKALLADPSYGWRPVTYNPYVNDSFVLADTREPISSAGWVLLTRDGKAWAAAPT